MHDDGRIVLIIYDAFDKLLHGFGFLLDGPFW